MEQYTPLMKAVIELEDFLIKARKMPIGTVSKGRKKIAEGKWVKVKGEIKKVQEKPKDQTETPEFKKWFGNSKVVDSSGKPLVVYHGTNKDFKEFDSSKFNNGWLGKGAYFTPDKNFAKDNGKKVIQSFLKIQNPFRVKGNSPSDVVSEVKEKYPEVDDFNLADVLKRNGYDGIYFNHWDKGEMYSAFSPTQIKSATGNQGTFDPNNPDMTKARE